MVGLRLSPRLPLEPRAPIGRRLSRALRLIAAVSAMALVAGLGAAGAPSTPTGAREPEPPRLPRSVTLQGTLTLDRRAHDACFVAVPPVLTAQVTMTIDTDAGTVTGTIDNGSGSGEYLIDGTCEGDDKDTMWQATSTFSGSFQGSVDTTTGAFSVPVQLVVDHTGEHGWFPGMPEYDDYLAYGGGFVCGPEITPTCPNGETVREQTATLTGQLQPDGSVTAGLDWYTGTCVAVAPTLERYTREGCPTAGTLELSVTDLVSPYNNPPEIAGVAVDPPEPTSDDTVIVTVSASDPDGDPLTYQWQIDGTGMGAATAQVSWTRPTVGDHTLSVRVSDPYGGVAESEAFVTVREGTGDRDGDGVPDGDDRCPDEFGLNADGCPDFAVTIGCSPARPMPGDAATCTAVVAGAHPGEDLRYDWYVGGGSAQSGGSPTWASGPLEEGSLEVAVDVLGEGRSASAQLVVEVTGGVVDAETAGFSIASIGCNSGITSDEILTCAATFQRTRESVTTLVVVWRIDGMVAAQEAVTGSSSGWALDRPAPGDHVVTLLAVDPVTNFAQAGTTPGNVRPGRNAAIPASLQALVAGATILTVGAWLWLEALNRSQSAAEAAEEAARLAAESAPRTDVPSWVTDPRPLAEIWAAEAQAEAARRGLSPQDWYWNDVTQAFEHRELIERQVDEAVQRDLRDQWFQLESVLGQNPNLAELAAFVRQNESNVWRGDRIDPEQMERLQRAVDRLGQAVAGYQRVPEYTWRRQGWDYMGSVSQSTAFRMLAALGTKGISELILQPWATHYRMIQRTEAGWAERDVMHAAVNETILEAGTTVVFGAGLHAFGGPAVSLASRASQRVLPAAWDRGLRRAVTSALQTVDDAYRFGSRPAGEALSQVRSAWQLSRQGVPNAWQVAADTARLTQLRAVNPELADAVEGLYRRGAGGTGGAGGGAPIRSAPTLAFTSRAQPHLWQVTDDAFRLTPDELAAVEILREMPDAYRDAVRQGLVPVQVNQMVNNARDRVVKHAMVRAYRDVRDSVRSGLQRVDITGSGANPTSTRAASGWTDFDATARGTPEAERAFAAEFYRQLRRGAPEVGMPGLNPRRIDATMFAGARPGGSPTGYQSDAMLRWVEVDAGFSGRSVAPTRTGNLVLGQQPSSSLRVVQAADEPGLWVLEQPPRFTPVAPGSPAARAMTEDVQRLIAHNHEVRPPTSVVDDLRVNGKHAARAHRVLTVGSGEPLPEGIRVLEQMKGDRRWVPDDAQVAAAAEAYQRYTGMTPGG